MFAKVFVVVFQGFSQFDEQGIRGLRYSSGGEWEFGGVERIKVFEVFNVWRMFWFYFVGVEELQKVFEQESSLVVVYL